MTWRQRHRLRSFIRSSLWIAPFVGMVVALLVAPAIRALDGATRWHLFGFGPEGARTVLGALTASRRNHDGLDLLHAHTSSGR